MSNFYFWQNYFSHFFTIPSYFDILFDLKSPQNLTGSKNLKIILFLAYSEYMNSSLYLNKPVKIVLIFVQFKVSKQERQSYETNWSQNNTVCFRGSLSSKSFMTTVFFLKKSDEAMRVGNHKKVPKIRTIFVN